MINLHPVMKRRHYIVVSVLFLLLVFPSTDICAQCCTQAQIDLGCPLPLCPTVPIDGGLSALLIAGAAYGAKKMYGKSKEEL